MPVAVAQSGWRTSYMQCNLGYLLDTRYKFNVTSALMDLQGNRIWVCSTDRKTAKSRLHSVWKLLS